MHLFSSKLILLLQSAWYFCEFLVWFLGNENSGPKKTGQKFSATTAENKHEHSRSGIFVPYLISGEGDNTVIYTFTKKMNDAAVAKQLENMVSFIKKEAEEKAEEILAKAEEDFTIEKAKKVQAQKLKLMKEFERKMKEVEVQKKM
jgi:hypothetical protein